MKKPSKLQAITFELEEIESIEEIGYRNCTDISVEGDASFSLSNGIISHNSAATGISQAIGRNGIGIYAGRGVPLNVWDCKTSDMLKNKEFSDITSLLGIDPSRSDNKNLNFDKIVLANDQDLDGTHIQLIYLGWWMKFGQDLFSSKKVARLMTPLVILWSDAKKTKIYKAFYSLGEYKEYESKNDISRYPKSYFKGLGSWSPEQFQHLFDSSPNGIEDYLQYFNIDENGETYVDNWLNSDKTDVRKQYLRDYTLDIDKV